MKLDIERLRKWLVEGGRSSAFEPNEWYNRCKDGRILQVESYGRDIDFDGTPDDFEDGTRRGAHGPAGWAVRVPETHPD